MRSILVKCPNCGVIFLGETEKKYLGMPVAQCADCCDEEFARMDAVDFAALFLSPPIPFSECNFKRE